MTTDNRLSHKTAQTLGQRIAAHFGLTIHGAYMGLACVHCYLWGIQRVVAEGTTSLFQPVLFFGLNATCLLFALLAWVRGRSLSTCRGPAATFAGLGAVAAFALLAWGAPAWGLAWELGCAVLCGVAVGGCYLLWFAFYSRLDVRQSVLIILLSVALGSAFKVVCMGLRPGVGAACVYAALPVVAVVCWYRSQACAPVPNIAAPPLTENAVSVLRRYALGMAVFGVALGFTRLVGTDYFFPTVLASVVAHGLEIAVALVLVTLVYRMKEPIGFASLWMFVLIVIATGLLVLEFTTGTAHALANAIFSAAQLFSYTFVLLALVDVAQRCPRPSDVVFGVGYPIYALPMAAVSLGQSGLTWDDRGLALVVLYVLLLSVGCCMYREPAGRPVLFVGLAPTSSSSPDVLSQQVAAVGEACGLTDRERDVARLYAQGRSRAFISDELCISQNTVRDHIAHIYKKLDVHNKQEFIDVLQSAH